MSVFRPSALKADFANEIGTSQAFP